MSDTPKSPEAEPLSVAEVLEHVAQLTADRDAARRESEKADDEARALKLRVKELEFLGTRDEVVAFYAMKRRAMAAEAELAVLRAESPS